jgi:hypothetical protein
MNGLLKLWIALAGLFVFSALGWTQDSLNVRRLDYIVSPQSEDVELLGDYAYVTTWQFGLLAVDISDPENLESIGPFYPPC